MAITLFSKILGFFRDVILSYYYGASNISDAFLISQTVPSVLFGFIGIALTTAYIPMHNKIEKTQGSVDSAKYTSNLINQVLLVICVVFIFSFYYADNIVRLFASGFHGETLTIAINFTRISLMGMFFTALTSILSGYLQNKGDFITPAIMGFPLNIITIIAIIVSSKGNISLLVIGTLIATASQFLIMIPAARLKGFKYYSILSFKDKNIKETFMIAIPVVLGVSVNQINTLVDRTIASRIIVGGISSLNYANRLNQFIQGLFVTSIIAVIYPTISKMATNNNLDGLKKTIKQSVIIVSIFIVPATIGSMIFAKPIISLLFGRGAFDVYAIENTTVALFYYSLGMLAFGLREILSRGFYAIQDTKTPTINASIGMALNIALNIILSRYLGIGGLALATSLSAIVTTSLLFISIRKKIGAIGMQTITISLLKILASSLVMGAISQLSFQYLTSIVSRNMSLIVSVGVGITIYFIIICFLSIEEFDVALGAIKKWIGKKIEYRQRN